VNPIEEKDSQEDHEIVDLTSIEYDDSPPADHKARYADDSEHQRISLSWWLLVIFLLACAVRITLLLMEKRIYVDGVHYLLEGDNIRSGVWDTWDPNGGRWTVPPFYPMLIAFFRGFINDLVLSGQLASLIVSLSIIPGIYLLAYRMYDKKVALWASFIVAVDPLCAHYSIVTYAEPAYMAMIVWSVYFCVTAISGNRKIIPVAAMGIFAALAYCTKAFGLVFFVWGIFILAFYLLRQKGKTVNKCIPIFTYIAAFLMISTPYWIFLTSYLGYPAPDGKSQYEFTRIQAPTIELERIDPRYEGQITDDLEYSIYTGKPYFEPEGNFYANYAKKYVQKLIEIFIDYPIRDVPPFKNVRLTTPLFLILLGLGLFSIPLTLNPSPGLRVLLAWLPLWLFIAPLSFIEVRYFVPIVPLLIPVVASGANRLEDWLRNTSVFSKSRSHKLLVPVTGLIILAFALPSLTYKMTHRDDPDVYYNEYKLAGDFMRDYVNNKPENILESAHMISFYAGMQGWVIPNTDFNNLIGFMLKHNIKFLALDEYLTMNKHARPQISSLFSFTGSRYIQPTDVSLPLKPIYWEDNAPVGHRIVIYELKPEVINAWNEKVTIPENITPGPQIDG
jgi:4-amino-4-deoxy-L-arabinose transferase-like glycosyltransferase